MTSLMTPHTAYLYLIVFGIAMIAITLAFAKTFGSRTLEGFLAAERKLPWWGGGPSIAASWTWAVALMISVQMAYQNGLAGSFWFILPNIIAVLLFVWLGPIIRERFPNGYSLPEWIHEQTGSHAAAVLYLIVFGFYQVMAVTVQIYAGAQLIAVASDLSVTTLMPVILVIALSYTLISGIEASVITDFIQASLILAVGGIIVTSVVSAVDGQMFFAGTTDNGGINPFSPGFALTTGIITSIGLMSGAIADQQLWQRCFSMRKGHVRAGFIFGALIFAAIPIGLSLLGFVAAVPEHAIQLAEGVDPSMVGFVVVDRFLSAGLATLFLLVLLAGLMSTLDSGLTAWSSLTRLSIERPWRRMQDGIKYSLTIGRSSMLVVGAIGLSLGYLVEFVPGFGLKYLWWFMNTMGTSIAIPTLLSLTWSRLQPSGILWGSGISIVVGVPLVAYSSIVQNDYLLSATYIGILAVNTIACIITAKPKEVVSDNSGGTEVISH